MQSAQGCCNHHELYFVVPHDLSERHPALFKGCNLLQKSITPDTGSVTCDIWHRAARHEAGLAMSTALPQTLLNIHKGDGPYLTFVFDAKVAKLPAQVLWDSGATDTFVDAAFVQRHNLRVKPLQSSIRMADDTEVMSIGTVTVTLQIQRYTARITARVIPLLSGIDLVLGDRWSREHEVQAQYSSGATPPSLKIKTFSTKKQHVTLFPGGLTAKPEMPATVAHSHVISAATAMRSVQHQPNGSRPAFMVMVREQRDDAKQHAASTSGVQTQLQCLIDDYADVFEQPRLSAYRDITPPVVTLPDNATPPNRPAFRLSIAERREIETRVKEMLELDWVQPSTLGIENFP